MAIISIELPFGPLTANILMVAWKRKAKKISKGPSFQPSNKHLAKNVFSPITTRTNLKKITVHISEAEISINLSFFLNYLTLIGIGFCFSYQKIRGNIFIFIPTAKGMRHTAVPAETMQVPLWQCEYINLPQVKAILPLLTPAFTLKCILFFP